MKGKRLLAERINVAMRFGPYMPLILVVPDDSAMATIGKVPFVDEVLAAGFQIDSPPAFQNHSPPCSPACVTG
jgi:hypothetical protein